MHSAYPKIVGMHSGPRRRATWSGRKCCSPIAKQRWFFAVGQRLGVHHQTVQRCVERALAYGALAALDDRPRPGKEPTITPEAKAWLVSLACDKAKEHGYPHELCGPSCARARTGGRARMSRPSGPRHGVQDPRPRGHQAAQGALLLGTTRRRVRAEDGAGSVCLPRGPGSATYHEW